MNKLTLYTFLGMFAVIVGLLGLHLWDQHTYQKQILDLQNKVAETSTTVQVTQDLYDKASIQSKNLSSLLDDSTKQNQELMKQINAQKGTILALTSVTLTPTKASGDIKLTASQPTSEPSSQASSQPYQLANNGFTFSQKVGRYNVSGDVTLTPPDLRLNILEDPLQLNVAVYQNKDQSWHTVVQTDDPNIKANIKVASVDPYILERHWYEKISFGVDLGYGQIGLLTGIKANYKIGSVDFGPDIWVLVNAHVNPIFGANLLWHPWEK